MSLKINVTSRILSESADSCLGQSEQVFLRGSTQKAPLGAFCFCYTIFMEIILKEIKVLYGLELSFVEKITKGTATENVVLTDNSIKYFLKRHSFNSLERVKEVHSAKHFFAEKGMPVILPMMQNNGETCFFCSGNYFALFPFIEGLQVEQAQHTENSVISMAEMLAKFHKAGAKSDLVVKDSYYTPVNTQISIENIERILEKIDSLEKVTKLDTLVREDLFLKKKLLKVKDFSLENVSLQNDHLIHGDYLDHNLFFDSHGHVSHIFDFEKAQYAPRVYEVVRSMMYSFLSKEFTDKEMSYAKLYIDSYRKIYPLSSEELRIGLSIYYIKYIHTVWLENEYYIKNNIRVFEYLKDSSRRLHFLVEKRDQLSDFLRRDFDF